MAEQSSLYMSHPPGTYQHNGPPETASLSDFPALSVHASPQVRAHSDAPKLVGASSASVTGETVDDGANTNDRSRAKTRGSNQTPTGQGAPKSQAKGHARVQRSLSPKGRHSSVPSQSHCSDKSA